MLTLDVTRVRRNTTRGDIDNNYSDLPSALRNICQKLRGNGQGFEKYFPNYR